MAFNTEKNKLQYDMLVKINTTLPLYLSDRDVVINEILYEGRILNVSDHREQINSGFNRKIAFPIVTITLANSDGYFNDSLNNLDKFWSMVEVEIYTVQRGSVFNEATDLRFKGFIEYSNGIIIKPDTITVKITDFRKKFNKKIPEDVFTKEEFNNLPEDMVNKPIPILFGDWTVDIPNNTRTAEAFVLDSGNQGGTTPTNIKCIVGRPGDTGNIGFIGNRVMIKHSGSAYNYSQCEVAFDISGDTTINLSEGTFEIDVNSWNRTNDPGTWEGSHNDKVYLFNNKDKFFIQCQGNTDTTLITNPIILIKHILIEYGDMADEDFDTDSYDILVDYFSSGENGKVRKQIVKQEKLWDIIGDLAWEFGVDIYNKNGTVAFLLKENRQASSSTIADVIDDDFVQNKIQLNINPENIYVTKVTSKYRHDPNANTYTKTYELAADITKLPMNGLTIKQERKVEFKWAYEWIAIMSRSVELISSYAKLNKVYTFTLGFKGLNWDVGSLQAITNSALNLDTVDIYVRSIKKNYIKGTVEIVAYDAYLRDNVGRWTEDYQDNWTDSSEADRIYWGFATDNTGNADPLGTDSQDSTWTVS